MTPTRIVARARTAQGDSLPEAFDLEVRPDGARCGGDCIPLELTMPPVGCVVISGLEAGEGALLGRPGTVPTRATGADVCLPASPGTTTTVIGMLDDELARLDRLPVDVTGPGDCAAPETCARITMARPRLGSAIETGYASFCALEQSGAGACFGDDQNDGALPADLGYGLARVGTSDRTVCGIDRGGDVRCIGWNTGGLLWPDLEPYAVVTAWRRVEWAAPALDFDVGPEAACAVSPKGDVRCAVEKVDGQVRTATLLDEAGDPLSRVRRLEVGASVCATTLDGMVHCAEPGEPTPPVDLPGPALDVVSIDEASCALLFDGRVACWGLGQLLGRGDRGVDLLPPDYVRGSDRAHIREMVRLDGAGRRFCGLDEDGGLHCWGREPEVCHNGQDDDRDGQLDCADWDCRRHPQCFRVPGPERPEPTPIAEPGRLIGFVGGMDGDEPLFARRETSCANRNRAAEYPWLAFPIVNDSPDLRTVKIAARGGAGHLVFVYRGPFGPDGPVQCFVGPDDLEIVRMEPGEVQWVLVTTAEADTTVAEVEVAVLTLGDPDPPVPPEEGVPPLRHVAQAVGGLPGPAAVDLALNGLGTCLAFEDDRGVCWGTPPLRWVDGEVETIHGGPFVERSAAHPDEVFDLRDLRQR